MNYLSEKMVNTYINTLNTIENVYSQYDFEINELLNDY